MGRPLGTCARCGGGFVGYRRTQRYCSAACQVAAHADRHRAEPSRACRTCGAVFDRQDRGHLAEVRAFLVKYNDTATAKQLALPLDTVTTRDRFGLVVIAGEPYEIVDIGLRMLSPAELFAAQGFPRSYCIAPSFNGKPLTKTAQIMLAGNSVCPQVAQALVEANTRGDVVRRAS